MVSKRLIIFIVYDQLSLNASEFIVGRECRNSKKRENFLKGTLFLGNFTPSGFKKGIQSRQSARFKRLELLVLDAKWGYREIHRG